MSKLYTLAVLALCTIALSAPIQAQTLYGSVTGLAEDASGSRVPGGSITISNKATGQTYSSKTDENGRYDVGNITPGTYDLKVSATGFKPLELTDISITPNTVTRVNLKLEVGAVSDTITVQAEAAVLQTDKSDSHTTITGKQIVDTPLGGYRNYQSLINLVPGATPSRFQNSKTDSPGRSLQTNVNGVNPQNNVTRIDGAASINIWLPHHAGYVSPAETIDTVNITTSAGDAEQGMAGGASITVVTKSGSNQLHGSAFEFNNNQHLNARNFFASTKPLSIYNNFGATLGGPIVKNKLFFFGSWDATRERAGAVRTADSVPTADQRAGDFSAFLPGSGSACLANSKNCATIYDPLTGNADGSGRTAFLNNRVPANRFSPAASKIQAFLPAPNQAGYSSNYASAAVPSLDRDFVDIKMNWNRSERHQVWGKYGKMWALVSGQPIFGEAGGPAPGADPGIGDTKINNGSVGHTYVISPNLLLDGVIGYQRQDQQVTGSDYGKNFGQTLGIPGMNGPDIRQSGFPNVQFGLTDTGVPNWMPLFRVEETYTTSHNVTWSHGAHEIRVGFDALNLRLNHWQPELSDGGPRGLINFNGEATALRGGAAPNQFNRYAAFLLGLPSQYQKGVQNILMTGREWQYGAYVRDRWQVSRNLTINLGLRYEYYPLMARSNDKGIERLDPNTNLVYLGGRGNVPKDNGITVSKKLFAPRFGIAYRFDDKTVFRMGYGINYDPLPFSRPLRGFYPLTINSVTNANTFGYLNPIDQGLPPVVTPDLSTGVVPLGNASMRSPYGGQIHRGYVQSWNVTFERKLPMDLVGSVAYVGTQTTNQLADYDINAGYPGSGTTGLPFYAKFGRTVPTNMWDGYLSSHYHSLQTTINKQYSKGLLIKGAYTYSKAINMTDDDGWASVGWNWAPVFNRNRAAAGYDRTHVFQIGWVYDLPVGRGKTWANSGPVSYILGNWQVNGDMSAYTGTPFTVTAPGTSLAAPNNTQTADQVKPNVELLGQPGPGGFWYDPTAFAPVTAQRFGTSGRNILRNPGVFNTDLGLFRNFAIKERATLSFRAEFQNLPNSAHFGCTGSGCTSVSSRDVTSTSFMKMLSSYGERQVRFGLRLGW